LKGMITPPIIPLPDHELLFRGKRYFHDALFDINVPGYMHLA